MAAPGRFSDAILLRSVDYRDADRVVTLLTRELGKVALMARGARRSHRRFAGSLEPYALLRAEVSLGRGEVGRLGQAQITRHFPAILRDLRRMTLAGAGLELVRAVAPEREPDERLFEATLRFLEVLDAAVEGREEILLAFQIRVASVAGLAPGLDVCARCGRRAPEGKAARFDPAAGSIVCRACGGGPLQLSGATRRHMQAHAGGGWHEGPFEWGPAVLSEARGAIADHLTAHLGKHLHGAGLVAQVGELQSPKP